MQVGIITVGGRQVGIVTQGDDTPDMTPPQPSSDDIGGAYGSPENYSLSPQGEGHSAPRHSKGGHHPEDRPHHADHRHGPGRYARGEERQKEQSARHPAREGDRNIPYSSSGNPFDRSRFSQELEQKPWLREKMKRITLGENQDPNANLAVVETMMNRAVVRGTSLEAQAKRHRSSGVDEGGYYAGWAPHYSSDKSQMFERNLGEALGLSSKGQSNISNYATDNSSGDLAARERATGSFLHHKTINGESFFSPGHAEPALRDRWRNLNRQAQDFERNKTAATAAVPSAIPDDL